MTMTMTTANTATIESLARTAARAPRSDTQTNFDACLTKFLALALPLPAKPDCTGSRLKGETPSSLRSVAAQQSEIPALDDSLQSKLIGDLNRAWLGVCRISSFEQIAFAVTAGVGVFSIAAAFAHSERLLANWPSVVKLVESILS